MSNYFPKEMTDIEIEEFIGESQAILLDQKASALTRALALLQLLAIKEISLDFAEATANDILPNYVSEVSGAIKASKQAVKH